MCAYSGVGVINLLADAPEFAFVVRVVATANLGQVIQEVIAVKLCKQKEGGQRGAGVVSVDVQGLWSCSCCPLLTLARFVGRLEAPALLPRLPAAPPPAPSSES